MQPENGFIKELKHVANIFLNDLLIKLIYNKGWVRLKIDIQSVRPNTVTEQREIHKDKLALSLKLCNMIYGQ